MIEEELIKKSEINHQLVEQMANLEIEKAVLNDQLTKAKEIIKDLLSLCEGETDSKLVFARAEQFLKEAN